MLERVRDGRLTPRRLDEVDVGEHDVFAAALRDPVLERVAGLGARGRGHRRSEDSADLHATLRRPS
jgi:hypothetical protein